MIIPTAQRTPNYYAPRSGQLGATTAATLWPLCVTFTDPSAAKTAAVGLVLFAALAWIWRG